MKERLIPFKTPMVRALLDGTKTQTRRIVKPRPPAVVQSVYRPFPAEPNNWQGYGDGLIHWYGSCPYGAPGDRLYVKEAWRVPSMFDTLPGSAFTSAQIWYEADDGYKGAGRYRHARFMPRWAMRITLDITDVRVERLQEISTEDAIAEGVDVHPDHHRKPRTSIYSPVQAYRDLWEQINGPDSWAANPWVWVVSFRRIAP